MRSDAQTERDLLEELGNDPEVPGGIEARVDAGTVHLGGSAPTYAGKVAARRAAERVAGVRSIIDEIGVVPPCHLQRSDFELRAAVAAALDLNVQVPRGAVRTYVVDGGVRLEGVVASHADRCAAEDTVAVLAGVRAILNRIRVEPRESSRAPIIPGIERAFYRSAALDCKHILVHAAPDGEILLRGTVRSWAELRDAERAAWSAPGVRSVVNKLAVVL
jgi:osmotically-inducible protein OsmY